MSKVTKLGHSAQESIVIKMADDGSTRKAIITALEAKGMTTKAATIAVAYHAETNEITFRGKGAQGWREVMLTEFEANPKMMAQDFRKILDDQFSTMPAAKRLEYTRYFFPMMSALRLMKA